MGKVINIGKDIVRMLVYSHKLTASEVFRMGNITLCKIVRRDKIIAGKITLRKKTTPACIQTTVPGKKENLANKVAIKKEAARTKTTVSGKEENSANRRKTASDTFNIGTQS